MTAKITTVGIGTMTLEIDRSPVDFSGQVTAGTIKPNAKEGESINFLNGDTGAGVTTYTYSVDFSFIQDLTETGLAGFLWKHRGQTAKLTYTPNTENGFSISGQVRLDPPETGGEVGTAPVQKHSFKFIGEPDIKLSSSSDAS